MEGRHCVTALGNRVCQSLFPLQDSRESSGLDPDSWVSVGGASARAQGSGSEGALGRFVIVSVVRLLRENLCWPKADVAYQRIS